MKMNKRDKFLRAVQILAPGNSFMLQVAQRVPEEQLPPAPGGMALELVAHLERLLTSTACPHRTRRSSSSVPAAAVSPEWNLSLTE